MNYHAKGATVFHLTTNHNGPKDEVCEFAFCHMARSLEDPERAAIELANRLNKSEQS